MRKILFYIASIIAIFSIFLGFLGINNWYYSAVIGVWLFFDFLHYQYSKNTTLTLLINNKKKFLNAYLLMLSLSFSIECLGRYILHYWDYPLLNTYFLQIRLFIFFPFILFSFYEMYNWMKYVIPNKLLSFLLSMLLGICIWELPNIFSKDWIYNIPYVTLNFFEINIIVILGWSFLIYFPDFAYKQFIFPNKKI